MASADKRNYRYLDSDEDRRQLVNDIQAVRRDLLRVANLVPEAKWYEPRYHGWTLAALLGHLQLAETLALRAIQLGLLGIRIPIPENLLHRFNGLTARVFQQRVVPTTLRGLQQNEKRIVDLILHLPVERFSRSVYHPGLGQDLTVEQAIQEFFYYHWLEHLHTLRLGEDVFYEPPSNQDTIV